VVVDGDHIVRMGSGPDPAGATIIDGRDKTLLPGFIDAHAHPFGGALKEAPIFGVTTELDMLGVPEGVAEAKKRASPDEADIRSAGYAVTAPGGHGTEYGFAAPTIKGPREAQAFVDARIAEGSDFIKIIYDDGKAYGVSFNSISKETLRATVAAAHKRKKLAVVHIATLQAAHEAIEAGADALVHLFIDRLPDPEFGKFAAAHRVFVVPTLSVLASSCGENGSSLARDKWLALFLTTAERAGLAQTFPIPPPAGCNAPAETIRLLRAAGVPVLAGTDAPNPGTAHGVSLHGELERLVQAGLTPAEALAGATSLPAARFGLDDRGTIAVGKRADLVLVRGDPTKDITATRAIVGVWKTGVRVDRAKIAAQVAKENADAAARRKVPPPVGSESGLIDDFEANQPHARFGVGWSISTDSVAGGHSSAKMAIASGGAQGSKGALVIRGKIEKARAAFSWAGALFSPGVEAYKPVNLSARKRLTFFARGDGRRYAVGLFAPSHGFQPAVRPFTPGKEWTRIELAIADFDAMDGSDLSGVLFMAARGDGPFELYIDDVRLE